MRRSLLAIFLIAATVRLLFLDATYAFWDESVYLLDAMVLAGLNAPYHELFLRPPLVSLLAAPFAYLSTDIFILAARSLLAVINALIVIPAYYLAERLRPRAGWIAALLTALLPLSIRESRVVMTDHLAAVLVLAVLVLAIPGIWSRSRAYIIGVLSAAAILTKFTAAAYLAVLTPLFVIRLRRNADRWQGVLVGGLLVATPYLAFSTAVLGAPFIAITNGMHVLRTADPLPLASIATLLLGTVGVLIALLAVAGAYRVTRKKRPGASWILAMLLWSASLGILFIVRGVSKPSALPWEPQRFLILPAILAIVLASTAIRDVMTTVSTKRAAKTIAAVGIASCLALVAFQYPIAYADQIAFEDIRPATKQMAAVLAEQNTTSIDCMGNCPPLALYSRIPTIIHYDERSLRDGAQPYIVSQESLDLQPIERVCEGDACLHLYRRA